MNEQVGNRMTRLFDYLSRHTAAKPVRTERRRTRDAGNKEQLKAMWPGNVDLNPGRWMGTEEVRQDRLWNEIT